AATDNVEKLPKADISKPKSRMLDEPSKRYESPISVHPSNSDTVTSYKDTSIAFHTLENKALTQEQTIAQQHQQFLDPLQQSYIQLPEVPNSHPPYQGIQSRIQPIETDITIPISNNLPQSIQSQIQPTKIPSLATYQESFNLTKKTADPDKKESSDSFENGRITKQGVVKLLFKLKKNNHHGYITPHDGSKDIIFHQKYVGDDIFSRLERGMAVEVTAHITAGKAYADCIRIL
ncbi:MAG: cold shock domain-containing protein, partial [Cyanobacteria bacterium P01_D01_bin.56]